MNSNYTPFVLFTIVVTLIACIANALYYYLRNTRNEQTIGFVIHRTFLALCQPLSGGSPRLCVTVMDYLLLNIRGVNTHWIVAGHHAPVDHGADGLSVTSFCQVEMEQL